MHFSTNVYPIYSRKACETLTRMGVPTPFDRNDIASYGLYVQRLEGLKQYAPAQACRRSVFHEPESSSLAWSDLNEPVLVAYTIAHCCHHLGSWLDGWTSRCNDFLPSRSMDSLHHRSSDVPCLAQDDGKFRIPTKKNGSVCSTSVSSQPSYQAFFMYGMRYTAAGDASLMITFNPIIQHFSPFHSLARR